LSKKNVIDIFVTWHKLNGNDKKKPTEKIGCSRWHFTTQHLAHHHGVVSSIGAIPVQRADAEYFPSPTGLSDRLYGRGQREGHRSHKAPCSLVSRAWIEKHSSWMLSPPSFAMGIVDISLAHLNETDDDAHRANTLLFFLFFLLCRRFGFANPETLANGEVGVACRGEEHDITLVWSITSGKRLLLADGQEVHFSNSKGNIFDFSWTMRGNHVLKVVAHSAPPLSAHPGFRQYDFFVNGQSFFTFPKVFRLGLAPNDPRGAAPPPSSGKFGRSGPITGHGYDVGLPAQGGYNRSRSDNIAAIEAPHDTEEEEAYLREAIKMSLEETNAKGGGAPASAQQNGEENLLLDFFAEPRAPVQALPSPADAPGYAVPGYAAQSSALSQSFLALPAPVPSAYSGYQSAPQQSYGDEFSAAPTQGYGAPAPAPPAPAPAFALQVDPFAREQAPAPPTDPFSQNQPPAYAYSASPSNLHVAPSQTTPFSLGFASPPAEPLAPTSYAAPYAEPFAPTSYTAPPAPGFAAAPAPLAATSFDMSLPAPAPAPASGSLVDEAYMKFVNMDTFDLVSRKDEQRANPFESISIGGQPSLADMKMMQNKVSTKKYEKNAFRVKHILSPSYFLLHCLLRDQQKMS
jgi:hypothetical protein